MAILQSDGLALEVTFNSFEYDWVKYRIELLWRDETIIKDNLLKRTPIGWSKRPYGTFLANDYKDDGLRDIIRVSLDTNKPACWEPVEPDAKIAIYPGRFFPFVATHYNFFDETEDMRKEIEEEGKHPDDLFTAIAFIDTYNFANCSSYSGEGISLHLIVERRELEQFLTKLDEEYDNLIKTRHNPQ